MKNSSVDIESKILDFMSVVYACYSDTTFANDRIIYAHDLAEATGWLMALRAGYPTDSVVSKILSPTTAKHFLDYWRQGDWGDKEANAFEKLVAAMRDQ